MNTKTLSIIVIVAAIALGGYVLTTKNGTEEQAMPAVPAAPAAGGMEIEFGNNSWKAITKIEISPAGKSTFTEIAMKDGKLDAGAFVKYAIPDGKKICTFDLRFTNSEGKTFDRPGVDLCKATYYHFSDK